MILSHTVYCWLYLCCLWLVLCSSTVTINYIRWACHELNLMVSNRLVLNAQSSVFADILDEQDSVHTRLREVLTVFDLHRHHDRWSQSCASGPAGDPVHLGPHRSWSRSRLRLLQQTGETGYSREKLKGIVKSYPQKKILWRMYWPLFSM